MYIPEASGLHFDFDPRCQTSGEADVVSIPSEHAWNNADYSPFNCKGFGEEGACFFGSYSRGNWPVRGITVVGDTATAMLCVTTHGRYEIDNKHTWGLKCTVRGFL